MSPRGRVVLEVVAVAAVPFALGLAATLALRAVHRDGPRSPRPVVTAQGAPPPGANRSTVASAPGGTAAMDPADSAVRLRVPVTDVVPGRLPAEGVPQGWEVREFSGRATLGLVRAEPGVVLRLRSEQTSFALYRDVIVDLREYPVLSWQWKVTRLPKHGDVRHEPTDDQAAQVYVVFPRWPSPRTRSDVIGYVWDTTAPAGTRLVSPKAPNVRIIVAESGSRALGQWQRQRRNVHDDYVALFGRRPPRVGTIAVMIDTNDTGGTAEALIGNLEFSRS